MDPIQKKEDKFHYLNHRCVEDSEFEKNRVSREIEIGRDSTYFAILFILPFSHTQIFIISIFN